MYRVGTCIYINHNRPGNDLAQTPIRVFLLVDSVQSTYFVIIICLTSYSEIFRYGLSIVRHDSLCSVQIEILYVNGIVLTSHCCIDCKNIILFPLNILLLQCYHKLLLCNFNKIDFSFFHLHINRRRLFVIWPTRRYSNIARVSCINRVHTFRVTDRHHRMLIQ